MVICLMGHYSPSGPSLLKLLLCLTACSTAERLKSNTTSAPSTLQIKVLKEILKGPLSDKSISFYIDSKIPSSLLVEVVSLEHAKKGYRVINVNDSGEQWKVKLDSSDSSRELNVVNIFLVSSDQCYFSKMISNLTNPDTVMIFSLSDKIEVNSSVCGHEVYQHVRNLAITRIQRKEGKEKEVGLYTILPFSLQKEKFVGTWDPAKFKTFSSLFRERFADFEGHKFLVAVQTSDFPYVYVSSNNGSVNFKGVEVNILATMSLHMNFTYEIKEGLDGYWGFCVNGSWNGLLGGVERGENAFVINNFQLTRERYQDFDASVTYMAEGMGVGLPKPSPLPKWFSIIHPFKALTWLFIVITLVITVVIMTIQVSLQPSSVLHDSRDAWIYIFRGSLNQGVPHLPQTHGKRVLLITWYIYCYILIVAYNSNLIAYLTISVPPRRIESVTELAKSDYKLGMEDYGSFLEGALNSSPDETYQRLGEKLELFQYLEEILERLESGTHVYIDGYSYVRYILAKRKLGSSTYLMKASFYPGPMCWYFPRHTPWIHHFNDVLTRIIEAGLVPYWIKVEFDALNANDDSRKDDVSSDGEVSLSLEHLACGFFVLVTSWVLSSFVFLAEVLMGRGQSERLR